ncbi:tRNA1(Val) (adenine(37)-N6)-methyltransferase [Kordiimonas aestuarii]|uniref:tRNA1(Val) (adenine(37)-N6)-methyltransferase n=1 Tax=Kordiimonas aestuarii TaxID=1005925 RepID=UPI0021D1E1E8|nr:methyltransferase domain-containing protein [Kordiimonas aestuarii]
MTEQTVLNDMPVTDAETLEPQADEAVSVDDFLGGAIKLIQPRDGYRVSMDTVMLAASVPAKAGDRIIEGGVGSAGAALCLAKRVPGTHVHGIDIQDDMLAFAERNIAYNQLGGQVTVSKGCITDLSGPEATYDHVMVNPPYLANGKAIRPPVTNKGLAHMDSSAALKDWVRFCIYKVKNRGTVSIIYRADRVDEVIAQLYRRVGELKIMPLWPRFGAPAKRVIIQGRKGVHGTASILPGLALHGEVERYTREAEAILRDGAALDLKGFARTR